MALSTYSAAQAAATTSAAAVTESSKLANEAREALGAARGSFGVTGQALDTLRNSLAVRELALRKSSIAADEAAGRLETIAPAKPLLGKFDSANAEAVADVEKVFVAALLAVEQLRPLLAAAKASAEKCSASYGLLPGTVRGALSISPPSFLLDGLGATSTPSEIVECCARIWRHRALALSLSNMGDATTPPYDAKAPFGKGFPVTTQTLNVRERLWHTHEGWVQS